MFLHKAKGFLLVAASRIIIHYYKESNNVQQTHYSLLRSVVSPASNNICSFLVQFCSMAVTSFRNA